MTGVFMKRKETIDMWREGDHFAKEAEIRIKYVQSQGTSKVSKC